MSLRWCDMDSYDIENALRPGAGKPYSKSLPWAPAERKVAGARSFQQIPYECPDSSFEFTTDSDILKPTIGTLVVHLFTIKWDPAKQIQ